MPSTLSYPGVYIEEVPSGVRPIAGVATSITAFIGRAARGLTNTPTTIHSFGDFERQFGGLWTKSLLGFSVRDFFLNGGSDAIIVRLVNGGAKAAIDLGGGLTLTAVAEGEWGNGLRAIVDYDVTDPKVFNLTVRDLVSGAVEVFRNVSRDSADPRFINNVLTNESALVGSASASDPGRPAVTPQSAIDADQGVKASTAGDDGSPITSIQFLGPGKTGLRALDSADLFNLLVIPPYLASEDVDTNVIAAAAQYCEARRAFLIVDSPSAWASKDKVDQASDLNAALGTTSKNAAVFFPRLQQPDPFNANRIDTFPASGALAGVFARTDAQRGVWKAPAGLDATITGALGLSVNLTDPENGDLNKRGINALRTMPAVGRVVWGARTLQGDDRLGSEWKYVPIRRLALFLEESLYRGTQWVVFEPNDSPLWAQVRLNVGAFLHGLFRQGAFQGKSPQEAYFVKCDAETNPQQQIDLGILNIVVGFAPLKPAEFVIIQLQQIAGQLAA